MSEDKKIPQVEAQIQLNGVQAMLKTAEGMQSTTEGMIYRLRALETYLTPFTEVEGENG